MLIHPKKLPAHPKRVVTHPKTIFVHLTTDLCINEFLDVQTGGLDVHS